MKTVLLTKRFVALFLALTMVFGLIACARPERTTLTDGQSNAVISGVKDYTREEMEIIVELLGDVQNTEDMTDEELRELVDEIVASNTSDEKESSSDIINLGIGTGKGENVPDLSGKEEFFDENGGITIPFDQIYPELIEKDQVEYSDESILVKLSDSTLTEGLKSAGVAALDVIVPLEEGAWYEAKLLKGTDANKALENVRALSEVILAEYNFEIKTAAIDEYKHFDDKTDEEFKKNGHNKDQWHFHHAGIPDGYEEMANKGGDPGIIVAVIDTGVDYDHEDLNDNIWTNNGEIPDNGIDDDANGYIDDYYGVNIITGQGNGDDDNGHGTHVAGIVAAKNNNVGVVGIAYNVKIMPIKAGSHSGFFNQADIARAVLYAYEMGAEVVNMSFGGPSTTIAVQDALSIAYNRCVLVAAAGNLGFPNEPVDGCPLPVIPHYPGALSYVLGVMSVGETGMESAFTNWDGKEYTISEYEVYAPGEDIMSTLPNDQYGKLSGTSMASPVVAAMAAILRGEFTDRDKYPTKFIYGQLASTSEYYADCCMPSIHQRHNLPQIVNLDSALTKLPKPKVTVQTYKAFDSVELSDKNNGDGVIDAGETIALGLTLRNQWGMSENTLVTLDTKSSISPEISDPYIEIVNETVNYGSVGTYSTQDCGKIMTDGLHTGWEDPFIIKVADNCPNDYQITFNISIECENGLDPEDDHIYTSEEEEYFPYLILAVRNGVILPSIIDEDMVLTKDNLYIIPNATVIQEGVTVRVEPGTNIQFWSDDPSDPYADTYIAMLVVNGQFLVEGTKDEPVYIYPSQLMTQFGVEISGSGYTSLKYADVTNLFSDTSDNRISYADHCTFRQNHSTDLLFRQLSEGQVFTYDIYHSYIAYFEKAENCIFYKLGTVDTWEKMHISGRLDCCIFVDCGLSIDMNAHRCVFLGNCLIDRTEFGAAVPMSSNIYGDYIADIQEVYYREETGTTYAVAVGLEGHDLLKEKYGLKCAVIETQDELDWLYKNITKTDYWMDIHHNGEEYVWSDGTKIGSFIDPNNLSNTSTNKYSLFLNLTSKKISNNYNYYSKQLFEIPGVILPTEITFEDYVIDIDSETTYQISPQNAPVQLPFDSFVYESTNEAIIKVNDTGLVTPVGTGTADVYVYSADRAVKNYVTFNVIDHIALEEFSFETDQLIIAKGETSRVKCVFTPTDTTRKKVTYSSDNENVATVDETGNVTAVGKGTANITAKCDGLTDTLSVEVYVKITSVDIADSILIASLSEKNLPLPDISFDEGAEPELIWRSTDENVAIVSNGKIELLEYGTTTLVVTDKVTGISDECTVLVSEKPASNTIKDIQSTNEGYLILFDDGSLYLLNSSVPHCVLTGVKVFSVEEDHKDCFIAALEDGNVHKYLIKGKEIYDDGDIGYNRGKNIVALDYYSMNGQSSNMYDSYYVITDDGIAYAWGYNLHGVLGVGSDEYYFTEPTLINIDGITDIEVTNWRSFFLTANGNVYCAGDGIYSSFPILVDNNTTQILFAYGGMLYYLTENDEIKRIIGGSASYCGKAPDMDSISFDSYGNALFLKDGKVYSMSVYVMEGDAQFTTNLVPGITNAQKVYGTGFILTEDNELYTTKASSLGGIYNEETDVPVFVPFSSVPIPSGDIILTETNLDNGILTDDALVIGFNKKLMSAYPKLYANGEQIPVSYNIKDINYISIYRLAGYVEGVEYKLVFDPSAIHGLSNTTLSKEISITFTYEKPETVPDETPDTPIVGTPEKVIHESVFDASVERILTAEKLQAQLDKLQDTYHFNDCFYGNAILNHISTNTNVEMWFRPIAAHTDVGGDDRISNVGQNYWGTTNETAIQLQMIDYTDFISYPRFLYDSFLTEAPEDTFPFVTSVKLINSRGEEVTTVGNEEITFRVSFNRDMDTSIPLTVRFGSAYPYGDYEIAGQYVDARNWEGTYTLNTIIENGNQFFYIANGCSATDDLELQPDSQRFGFVIDTTAAQALIMQGSATDTGIELKWTQDDFDTLMGYNVYRSDREDGFYTRLNNTVIPYGTMNFFDNTVEPGKVYYYNFTVVKTDLTESEPSGKITIMSKDTMAPDIYHSPVANAFTGSNLVITATVTDNLYIAYANLYYRAVGETEWMTVRMNALNDKYSAIIRAGDITVDGIEYYIEAFDGISYTYKASADDPFIINVQEAVGADALGDVDGDGTITNRDALVLLYAINDKYNMTAEEFARADLNGDGELWAAEALRILQYVNGTVGSVKMS